MAVKSYEQQLAEYDAQLSRIKARRHALVARNSKAERKARTHALIVAGGLVMSCFDGGWQSVDWGGLATVIDSNREIFASMTASRLPTSEASKRLHLWENSRRK